jgi:hypothetical protein
MDKEKHKLTVEQKDNMYLHLMCAAVTGLASQTHKVEWTPKRLAEAASEMADEAMDLCVVMHEAHVDEDPSA